MTAARQTWSIEVTSIDGERPPVADDAVTYPDALTLADALHAWLDSSDWGAVRLFGWRARRGGAIVMTGRASRRSPDVPWIVTPSAG